ncbi:MAG: hypothetical protein ACU0CY_02695 [Maritimibacter harenae]
MRTALLLFALAAPMTAQAEGAKLALDCTGPDGATHSFLFAPVETDDTGMGLVTVGDDATPGIAGGFFGPWSWIRDEVKYTLMVDGDATDAGVPMLLHALDTTSAPFTSTLENMTCEAPF